ncbi:hypothetical protein GCM10012285_03810 [Streptomyces kronopolitis]|uniref:Uncharacterized protein n=1 Tax=Streptomyces kronopolitis TaxID=1612435 RepID=A0ABQ2IWD0_9ACTN|nr:hypothetical protein GCM10012285_03810 [Streptomyces kronopolitis]
MIARMLIAVGPLGEQVHIELRDGKREPYPNDLSDGQQALIESMITAWKQDR